MSAFILCPHNIDCLKQELRAPWSKIWTSHRVELIARALGFKTFAALRTVIGQQPDLQPSLAFFNLDSLRSGLASFGYEPSLAEEFQKLLQAEFMPAKLWVCFKQGDRFANNMAFYDCQTYKLPFLNIQKRRKYADLNWDCISMEYEIDMAFRGDDGTQIVRSMFELFKINARLERIAFFEVGAFYGNIKGLLPDTAVRLAEEYIVLIMKCAEKLRLERPLAKE
jgi:hypothetical protein